ncbi:MAG TPA: M14 family zinc carboxypeptidase [bacterium]|nr:M14 family zinc carboxypeptidase [bacterium]
MRTIFAFLLLSAFATLDAAGPMLWDVAVDRDDPELKDAFGALDVWSVYRDADGVWHYRVAAAKEELSQLRLFAVRIAPVGVAAQSPMLLPAEEYRDAATVTATLESLEKQYPDRAKLYVVGKTFEERDIVAIKISADPSKNVVDKQEFLFTGTHHAREWIGTEVTLRMAEFLLEQYDHSDRIKEIVDACEIWIVPMLNQDGYRFSWEDTRLWRKNRRLNAGGTYGVDLNRNYDAGWGGAGSSKTPSSDTYRGTAAFSEPETAAVRDLLDPANGWFDDAAGYIDFHSYSQLILYPYGNTYETSPREKEMAAIAGRIAELIEAETGYVYTPQKSSELYIATGGSSDWFHLAHDFKNTLTMEVRPNGDTMNGFVLATEQIKGTARENAVAAMYFIEATMQATDAVDTDVNGNGVVDYLEGCGTTRCEMLYDERGDEIVPDDDDPVTDDGVATDDDVETDTTDENDIKDADEKTDNGQPDQSDQAEISDETYSPDETAVVTDTDTNSPRRAVSSGGCSVVLF